MRSDRERERLRGTFEHVAELYDRARPGYPDVLIDHLVSVTGLRDGDRVLEIGCGAGQATVPLARRGFRITCVELGPRLGAAARRRLSAFPDVAVVEAAFEAWALPAGRPFDAVVAATSWDWIDPAVRYRKAWQGLRPGGYLAFWNATHVIPEDGDPFFEEMQEIYDEIGEPVAPGSTWPRRPGRLEERRAEIEAEGLFEVVDVRQFDWETVHDADGYLDLLSTFSGHIAMEAWQRDRLDEEVRRRLATRPNGRVRRHWGAALHVARRVG